MNMAKINVRGLGKARGFTLLEVLIGVLVLSLALLGLAAMFPVVVRTQRIARDTVVGTGVLEAAEATIRGNENFSSPLNNRGLRYYADQLVQEQDAIETKWQVSLSPSVATRRLYEDDGRIRLEPSARNRYLRPADRLNLMPGVGAGTDPTLVWDMVVCLASETDVARQPMGQFMAPDANVTSMPRPLRVALFVRRLDPQIRVRTGQTMLDGIVAGNIVPIGASQASFGDPTLDGTGFYSQPMYTNVTAARKSKTNGPFDILEFAFADNGRLPEARAMAKPGQILIDNQGGIHTVSRNVRDNAGNPVYNQVLLEKPMLESFAARCNSGSEIQVTFTEQVPVAARVITIKP